MSDKTTEPRQEAGTDRPAPALDAAGVEALFTRAGGGYAFARWGRPIVPVLFGCDDATLAAFKGATEAVVALAGHRMAETDPEMGANLMIFFLRDWTELADVPDLDRLMGQPGADPGGLIARLRGAQASQYRMFRFDPSGAIRACIVFLRIDAGLAELPAEVLALDQAARMILGWSDRAFGARGPLETVAGRVVLRPDIAGVIRAAYDPAMPVAAGDASHALRLAARLAVDPGLGAVG